MNSAEEFVEFIGVVAVENTCDSVEEDANLFDITFVRVVVEPERTKEDQVHGNEQKLHAVSEQATQNHLVSGWHQSLSSDQLPTDFKR